MTDLTTNEWTYEFGAVDRYAHPEQLCAKAQVHFHTECPVPYGRQLGGVYREAVVYAIGPPHYLQSLFHNGDEASTRSIEKVNPVI